MPANDGSRAHGLLERGQRRPIPPYERWVNRPSPQLQVHQVGRADAHGAGQGAEGDAAAQALVSDSGRTSSAGESKLAGVISSNITSLAYSLFAV